MSRVVLITGGNLGDREANLKAAREAIAMRVGEIVSASSERDSEPWGEVLGEDEGPVPGFLNQILIVETSLDPFGVLDEIQDIEKELGRARGQDDAENKAKGRYFSRTMDIDILFYDDKVVDSDRLTIPHPKIEEREFVLALLSEVMPGFRHPVSGHTMKCHSEQVGGSDAID